MQSRGRAHLDHRRSPIPQKPKRRPHNRPRNRPGHALAHKPPPRRLHQRLDNSLTPIGHRADVDLHIRIGQLQPRRNRLGHFRRAQAILEFIRRNNDLHADRSPASRLRIISFIAPTLDKVDTV